MSQRHGRGSRTAREARVKRWPDGCSVCGGRAAATGLSWHEGGRVFAAALCKDHLAAWFGPLWCPMCADDRKDLVELIH
jgi:hypothetical protein